jgi:hypothetical protein
MTLQANIMQEIARIISAYTLIEPSIGERQILYSLKHDTIWINLLENNRFYVTRNNSGGGVSQRDFDDPTVGAAIDDPRCITYVVRRTCRLLRVSVPDHNDIQDVIDGKLSFWHYRPELTAEAQL